MADSVPPLLPKSAVPPVIDSRLLPPILSEEAQGRSTVLAYRIWCCLFVILYLALSIYSIQVARGNAEPALSLIEAIVSHDDNSTRAAIISEKRASAREVAVVTALVAVLYGLAAA